MIKVLVLALVFVFTLVLVVSQVVLVVIVRMIRAVWAPAGVRKHSNYHWGHSWSWKPSSQQRMQDSVVCSLNVNEAEM